ncbi:MAG: hypothetical protein HQ473_07370 [Cryomorphaceae bacterium]|nr:hypothetical protein [Cryomorphaceae bacterium]
MELTQEEIAQSISAAFDSVNLIAELKAKESVTEDEQATIDRNVEHLSIMLGKEWFLEALTAEQAAQINAVI